MTAEAVHEDAIHALCQRAGFEATQIDWLAADLSLRRFARVSLAGAPVATAIARVEAPEDPAGRPSGVAPEPPLEPIRDLLERNGLPVPKSFGIDADAGVQLLEDCGRLPLRDAVATLSGPERWSLHIEACDWVARLQAVPREAGVEAFGRRLDATLLAYKADLVIEHGLTARGRATTSAEAEVVRAAFSEIEAAVQEAPSRLAHRDYQSANLLVDPAAPAGQRLRMIDLQGAFLAPPEYDLVCLLCDSYIEIPEETIVSLREAIRPKLPDAPDPDECARRFDLLTLSRKGKDHARFLYAARQRGDTRFLDWVPYTVRLLQRAAQRLAPTHPALASYAELVHALPESPCAP